MTDPITTPKQMREAAALLPCPFCGGDARIWQDPSHSSAFFIGCDDADLDCFGSINWAETEVEAIAAWNRRAIPVAPQPVAVTVKPLPYGAEELNAALAEYTPGIDRAVRFVTIDQVDALAEFYLQNRNATSARDVRAAALREAAAACRSIIDGRIYFNQRARKEDEAFFSAIIALIDKEAAK